MLNPVPRSQILVLFRKTLALKNVKTGEQTFSDGYGYSYGFPHGNIAKVGYLDYYCSISPPTYWRAASNV